ncbi:hypothetical protein TSTA_124020 [Talaromyces stipitatus ATCC 10500]|uniref:Uncharacterized protein n=1 Tax=Talaromyces stipitatus (strain ATCC 10500 / CBS 375.48 / QM 6759 / NRRL 1006) TaxID=441959 RepID=B8MAX2_TALSN|nr:uncharacterized protein TSTA_124020 [Talaromyces stipitatus ATCC 10500]EED18673.1 hypothetical protein TSTA_124020 [Talaromyces stipitatus ATCC 10500]
MDATSLSCSICNKKPQFSDISHLLTHIASKAHLASHFRLQVKSHHDPFANEALTQYDQWYEENDIARLLSDRMASSKSSRRRPSNRSLGTETDVPSQSSFTFPENNIDPRLSDAYQPLTEGGHDRIKVSSLINSSDPRGMFAPKVETGSPLPGIENIPWYGHNRGRHSFEHKYNPFLSMELHGTPLKEKENLEFSGSNLDIPEDKKVDEVSRLKGIQWPGMDCFDAASDAMKRQRNQKKDASTFKAMEAASCASEPSELVFSPSGTLRRERQITGFVEEDDLLPGEWTIPKYRRDRRDRRGREIQETSTARGRQGSQRIALAVADANRSVLGGRVAKREPQAKRSALGDEKRREPSIQITSSKSKDHGLSHGHFRRTYDEDVDLQLSAGPTGRRRLRSRLNIFRDNHTPEVEHKRDAPSLDIVSHPTTRNEQHGLTYQQRASDALHNLMETNDSYKMPTLSHDTGPTAEHSDSHNRTSAPNTSRNIDGIYLVDTAIGPTHRVPYDPLVGGNVLHYRWDWHGTELGRGANDADDSMLDGSLFYNRAVSTDSTIYQDEQDTKSCLWLDGSYGR